jgi:hypothetical protein
MGQSTMDNPEKLAVYDTQTKTNKKHNMGYVTSRSIKICWKVPCPPNGNITSYILNVNVIVLYVL